MGEKHQRCKWKQNLHILGDTKSMNSPFLIFYFIVETENNRTFGRLLTDSCTKLPWKCMYMCTKYIQYLKHVFDTYDGLRNIFLNTYV